MQSRGSVASGELRILGGIWDAPERHHLGPLQEKGGTGGVWRHLEDIWETEAPWRENVQNSVCFTVFELATSCVACILEE